MIYSYVTFGGYAQTDNCTDRPEWIMDGYCDRMNNNEFCGYDGGKNTKYGSNAEFPHGLPA